VVKAGRAKFRPLLQYPSVRTCDKLERVPGILRFGPSDAHHPRSADELFFGTDQINFHQAIHR